MVKIEIDDAVRSFALVYSQHRSPEPGFYHVERRYVDRSHTEVSVEPDFCGSVAACVYVLSVRSKRVYPREYFAANGGERNTA